MWLSGRRQRFAKPSIVLKAVQGFESLTFHQTKEFIMPMYETTVKTPQGEEKKRIYAENVQEAKKLFEQLYGGPRAVPYIPKVVAS